MPVEEQYSIKTDNRERFLRIVDYTNSATEEPRYIDKIKSRKKCKNDDVLMIRYGASAGQVYRGLEGVFANNLFTITPKVIGEEPKQIEIYENATYIII